MVKDCFNDLVYSQPPAGSRVSTVNEDNSPSQNIPSPRSTAHGKPGLRHTEQERPAGRKLFLTCCAPVFPNGELVALPGGGHLKEVIHGIGGLVGGLQVHSQLVAGGGASGEIVQLVQSCKREIPTPDQPVCVSIHHRQPRLSSLLPPLLSLRGAHFLLGVLWH